MLHPTFTLGAAAALFSLAMGGAFLSVTEANAEEKEHRLCSAAEPALKASKIATLLEEQGYTILEFDHDDGCLEVEVRNSAGMEQELLLEPSTGKIVRIED